MRIIHPMKLIFGSNSIIGIPKFAKSAWGFISMVPTDPHIITIHRKVMSEVYKEYFKISDSKSRKFLSDSVNLLVIYQPTGNPIKIGNIGTPIPIPTSRVSRII
ncbi:MAG: hypothetical protein ACP5OJ_01500 [Methanothermobacter sp.]